LMALLGDKAPPPHHALGVVSRSETVDSTGDFISLAFAIAVALVFVALVLVVLAHFYYLARRDARNADDCVQEADAADEIRVGSKKLANFVHDREETPRTGLDRSEECDPRAIRDPCDP